MATIGSERPAEMGDAALQSCRSIHRSIAVITDDFEKFRFNRAVARVRELTNMLGELDGIGDDLAWVRRFGAETAAKLIGPMMPHLAEEIWHQLGHETLLVEASWPEAEAEFLVEDSVTVAVQVNGKLRATLELSRDAGGTSLENQVLALPGVVRAMDGRAARKVIVVPNKVVNVVV